MKKFFIVLSIFLLTNVSVCSAIGTEKLILGYLSVSSSTKTILDTYGKPNRVDNSDGVRWLYGKDFYIQFVGRYAQSVGEITTEGNNGIITADGVGVGMSEEILQEIYGEPTKQEQIDEENLYWYYGDGKNSRVYLFFGCTEGKIKKISLAYSK